MIKKINNNEVVLSLTISIYSVVFLWWFFENWVYALWFNASIFGLLFIWYYLLWINKMKDFIKDNLYWFIPLLLLVMSFSIYENPYLKTINILVLPVIILFFFWFAISKFEWNKLWNLNMMKSIARRKFLLWKAYKALSEFLNRWTSSQVMIKKIAIWISIFLWLNTIIVILLMWADSNFSEMISNIFKFINSTTLIKVLSAFILLIVLTSIKLTWKQDYIIENIKETQKLDSIVSWIVLWGTLFTYLLFIWVQVDSIFINTLPVNMENLTSLVKNWFWQLFYVSIINIIMFFVYYKKTSSIIQKILLAFIFASIIILVSASSKMYMYVYDFWLSYEKFAASYTVIYFWILFLIMVGILLLNKKVDILKTSIILAVWMYSLLNIIPMEIIILKTNILVYQRTDSRINKYQSHMLSTDIMWTVQKLEWKDIYIDQSWEQWVKKRLKNIEDKSFYEKNISNF